MGAFNPWHGFPSYNCVYLDQNFERMRGNGQAAFGTWQEAYDYADSLNVSTGVPVIIMVGNGLFGAFGNLTLTADSNVNVGYMGIGPAPASLGDIHAETAVNGFNVMILIDNVRIGTIFAQTTNPVPGSNGGNVVVQCSGNGEIDTIKTSALTSSNAGNVTCIGIVPATEIDARALGDGGDAIILDTALPFQCGLIRTSSSGAGAGGNIYIPVSVQLDNVDLSSAAGIGGDLTCNLNSVVKNVTMGASNPGVIKAISCRYIGPIDNLNGNSRFLDTDLFSENNDDVIAEVDSDEANFVNCNFYAGGTGKAINSTAPHTVIMQGVISRSDVDANVTINGSDFTVDTALVSPTV